MYSRMVLMLVCCLYRMPLDLNGCVFTLVNVDWIKWTYFCVNEFEVGINDSIFFGNEQQNCSVFCLPSQGSSQYSILLNIVTFINTSLRAVNMSTPVRKRQSFSFCVKCGLSSASNMYEILDRRYKITKCPQLPERVEFFDGLNLSRLNLCNIRKHLNLKTDARRRLQTSFSRFKWWFQLKDLV